MALLRGAIPSPRHVLAAAVPHTIVGETPPQKLWVPPKLSMWGNDNFGDCVTAEEAFAKAATTAPEEFIPLAEVINWAGSRGFLNGAMLPDVMNAMQRSGFLADNKVWGDGPYKAVDWTNAPVLHNAIAQGPVKLGVAAAQLEKVSGIGEHNGWFAVGFERDEDLDHCISLCGYGEINWLAEQLGVEVPAGVDGSEPGYGAFTWSTIGIFDVPSMLAITGEAFLRNPTTVVHSSP